MGIERRVFVSVNADKNLGYDDRRSGVKGAILNRLASAGYEPQLFFEAGLPMDMVWTFQNVISVMRRCVGAIVIGFPRWRATISGESIMLMVAFLHLHGSRPVGGEYGTEVAWRYSYQVIPPGGAATDTAG